MFNIYSVQYEGTRRKITFREGNTHMYNINRGWTIFRQGHNIKRKNMLIFKFVLYA